MWNKRRPEATASRASQIEYDIGDGNAQVPVSSMVATCLQAYQHDRLFGIDPARVPSVVVSGSPHGCSGPEGFGVFHVGSNPRERPNIVVGAINL
jgi:hypothetical protein